MKFLTLLFTALASCAVARGSAVASPASELSYLDALGLGSATPCHGASQDVPITSPPVRLTNGERLRRHLPLLPPTRRSRHLAPRASVLPIASTGKLAVTRSDNGNLVGYMVPVTASGIKFYGFGPLEQAVTVQLESTAGGSRISIAVLNSPYTPYGYLGFGTFSGRENFDPSFLGYSFVTGTSYIGPGSTPVSGNSIAYPNGWAETSIWAFDPSTKQLTAQWISPNGAEHPNRLFYSQYHKFLAVGNNINEVNRAFAWDAYAVTLTYVPDV